MIRVLQAQTRREVEAFLEWFRMRNFCNYVRLRLQAS